MLSVIWAHQTALAMLGLTLATIGILTTLPLFWSLPTAFLGGTAAAAGIAMINSIGNLAGFLSPYMMGWLKQATAPTIRACTCSPGFSCSAGCWRCRCRSGSSTSNAGRMTPAGR